MKTFEQFQREVARRRRERWYDILASEPPGRVPGRRPRDPEKERLLTELDRQRVAGMIERLGIRVVGGTWRGRADPE